MPTAGFAYAFFIKPQRRRGRRERCLRLASPTHGEDFTGDANGWLSCGTLRERLRSFLTNHRDTEQGSDAFGWLSCGTLRERLRTLEILQAITHFKRHNFY
ncbi:MAG: hypothetical protein V7K27_28820 [Nostoc sp.]|uniref:hypothetical protein n=1 Tax=Nostoc sp. TaxID=1180 RepID=UPI002FFAC04F